MLDRIRQTIGNIIDERFNSDAYPLDPIGNRGPVYKFLHPVTMKLGQEHHILANRKYELDGSTDPAAQQELERSIQELLKYMMKQRLLMLV